MMQEISLGTHTPASPDGKDRAEDFYSRHGGPSQKASQEGDHNGGLTGWSEVYAHDGYTLRCEWSKFGSKVDMSYAEIAPDTSR
jgi:hypothetical protein